VGAILLAFGLLASPKAAAHAQIAAGPSDTVELTLDGAVQRALARGTEMRVARSQVLEADGRIREAFAGALPQVTGSLVYTRQFASIYQGVTEDTSVISRIFKNSPFGAPNLWTFQIQATQLLWSGGKVGAGLAGARMLREGAASLEAQTAADITLAVKQAYLNAEASARLLEIARTTLTQARDHEHQVQLLNVSGTRADYDLMRAQVDAANQEPAAIAARSSYDLALRQLKRLIDVADDQPVVLTTPLVSADDMIPIIDYDSLPAVERPALQAAEAAVGVQEAALRVARADRWPSLSATTTYSESAFPQNVFPSSDQFVRGWNGELRMTFPIFLGFRTAGTEARARAGLLRALAERDQVRQQVSLELAQARAEVERTRSLLSARSETVRLAARTMHLAGVRYANGIANELEVSDARVLAQQAEVNEVMVTRDYLVALAQLERALGRPLPTVRRPLNQVAHAPTTKDSGP
jgi:outer membrane protein TolC